MPTNVDPQEVEALTGDAAEQAAAFAGRDFAQPLRLGAERLLEIRRRVEAVLFKLTGHVQSELCAPYEVSLEDVREIHADQVRAGLEGSLAAARFGCRGQVGWAVWDNGAAVRAVETLLCGRAPSDADRPLTQAEAGIVASMLERVSAELGSAFEMELDAFEAVTGLGSFGSWHEPGKLADPHRVAFDLALSDGTNTSEVSVYLAGFGAEAAPAAPALLPGHLDEVEVELSARLGEIEIPLNELLGLEPGDVIPLGSPTSGTLAVTVDGWEFARARLGKSGERLAIALTELNPPGSDEPTEEGQSDG